MMLLLGAACAAAFFSNALAGPTRHLAWRMPPRPAFAPQIVKEAAPPSPAQVAPHPQEPAKPSPLPLPSKRTAPVEKPSTPVTLQSRFPVPADGAPFEIDGAAARALFDAGARFLDARRTAAYEEGHVRGARSVSVWEDALEARLQAFDATTKDPHDPLVIYCSGGSCRDSHDLAQRLWGMGYRNLRIYSGGWPEWHEKGWPSAGGPDPEALR
jgi:rhodanese-related sulfurtransferase